MVIIKRFWFSGINAENYLCKRNNIREMNIVKLVSAIFLVIMLANFLLFIFVRISTLVFWIITIVVAVFAYLILPKLKV
jgi:hypothetical protein